MNYPNIHFQIALDALPSAFLLVDQEGVIQYANREIENLFGYARETLVGNSIEILIPTNMQAQHQRDRSVFLQKPEPRPMGKGRYLHAVRRDRSIFPVEIGLNPINFDESVYVLCSVIDMTFQKKQEEKLLHLTQELEMANKQLSHLAMTDQLTGLLNRHAFFEQFVRQYKLAARAKHSLSLLILDIDHFKSINDQYGHLVGDETLQSVAKLLSNIARTTDILARYGGEEFVLVLPATGRYGALELAERCRSAIKSFPGPHKRVTVSIGIATVLPSSSGKEDIVALTKKMLAAADKALFYSKENGRDRVTHVSDILGT